MRKQSLLNSEKKQLFCQSDPQHQAIAKARYTIGFAVNVEANVKLEYSGDGHAWTEIYLEGYGWIPLEVTGGNLYMGE